VLVLLMNGNNNNLINSRSENSLFFLTFVQADPKGGPNIQRLHTWTQGPHCESLKHSSKSCGDFRLFPDRPNLSLIIYDTIFTQYCPCITAVHPRHMAYATHHLFFIIES